MTGRIVMFYRKVSLTALFLVPFTIVWSGFSMTGIYGSQLMKHQFDPKLSLFGLHLSNPDNSNPVHPRVGMTGSSVI